MTEPQTRSRRPEYFGDPTIGRVATRPRWLAALVLALLVSAGFAWLGQWQLGNAIRTDGFDVVEYDTARPLTELAEPGIAVSEAAAGAVVTTQGTFRVDDLQIVAPRDNAGEEGAWVVGHLVVPPQADADSGAAAASKSAYAGETAVASHLVVALGWAPDVIAAEHTVSRLESGTELDGDWSIEGRFMPAEAPVVPAPEQDPALILSMVPSQILNLWNGVNGPTYAGYLVMHPSSQMAETLESIGLDPIDSVAPEPPEAVSWLNVFYAIEWIVFAGFAVFLWYRLVRDAWEKEHEMMLLIAERDAAAVTVDASEAKSGPAPAEPSDSGQ